MNISNPGNVTIKPAQTVIAGSLVTITYTYTTEHPVDDSGCIKIVFRFASDMGTPQFNNSSNLNYCSVKTTGNCRIEPRWDPKGHTRPWGRSLYLKVRDGFLAENDKIILVFGDTEGGSPGWQMQTFCEETFEFKTLVDPIATYKFKELPVSPVLRIIPGEPDHAVCITPSQIKVNNPFNYYLKLEDKWGNPVNLPLKIAHPGFLETGVQSINLKDEKTGLSAQSNPISVIKNQNSTTLNYYWADFHGQSEETIGSNSIEDYFIFARDYGLLDIGAHQGNDFQVTDEFWEKINNITKKFNKTDKFVAFPGYEWSGNTPLGGDRNVYFGSEGGDISRSSTDLLPGGKSVYIDSPTANDLFSNLKDQKDYKPFSFAHVGGRYADLSMHDPEIELAVEIHSAWGTFEWLLDDAFKYGYRMGICANSDGHKGRPGASWPGAQKFGSFGGLTCVLASELDRGIVLDAMYRRHFYASTGNRCLIELSLEDDNGQTGIMGDLIKSNSDKATLKVRVIGSAPIESIEVRNGSTVVETFRPFNNDECGNRIKVVWSGAEVRGRDRITVWDGNLQVQRNTIIDSKAVNFWNYNNQLEKRKENGIAWKSITTGGLSGVILTLEKPDTGLIKINTFQKNVECQIDLIGIEPSVWDCGGLQKKIEIYRLPDYQKSSEFSFSVPLTRLHSGDNPIYIKVTQEDGHMAWTSPVYWT